jgi:ubiquinone/menaquinone biosynthesis C-methylase UbiE
MQASQIDPGEFREAQRNQWDGAATGWDKWEPIMGPATQPVSDLLVEMADIQPGNRVIDVAAGLGEPSLTAARAVGADGSVVATDISAEMLEYAGNRAAREDVANIEFVQSAGADLDFPAESFDAALSRFGIIFEPDGEGTAARVRGFLRPGSRMAIASWGPPDRVPMLGIPMLTVLNFIDAPPPPPGTPGPLSRPTPEAIGGLLEGGGFSDIEVRETEVVMEYDSPEDFTTFIREIAPPISALLASQPPEKQEEGWNAITEAVRDASDGESVRFPNLVLVAAGRA